MCWCAALTLCWCIDVLVLVLEFDVLVCWRVAIMLEWKLVWCDEWLRAGVLTCWCVTKICLLETHHQKTHERASI
jgi:hypothetical protein